MTAAAPSYDQASPAPLRLSVSTWIGLIVLGAAAFLIAMIALLPASTVAPLILRRAGIAPTGTVWVGRAALPIGANVSWRTDIIASLMAFSPLANVRLEGPSTDITASATPRAGGVQLSGMRGKAGWSLVASAFPGLALTCDVGLTIEDGTLLFTPGQLAISGRVASSAGTCQSSPKSKPFAAPATKTVASNADRLSRISVSTVGASPERLADIVLSANGDIKATILPAALALSPGTLASGSVEYEWRAR